MKGSPATMPTPPFLEIRDAGPPDLSVAADVLVDAFHHGVVFAWAEPDEAARDDQSRPLFGALLEYALAAGVVRVTASGATVTGVAVWFPYPAEGSAGDLTDALLAGAGELTPSFQRLARLEAALQARHPRIPHHHLAYLGVGRDSQRRGIGSALVEDHHAVLRKTGTPAYLEANDPRNRELYRRLGYTDVGAPITEHGGPPVHPMWWSPDPGAPLP